MNKRLGVAYIVKSDGDFIGSCFFISNTQVLTCRHVVEQYLQPSDLGISVVWLGEHRGIKGYEYHEIRDAVVLSLSRSFSLDPVVAEWASYTPAEGHQINIAGFNKPDTYNLEVLTRFLRGYTPQYDLCVLDNSILPGFSGSPAFIHNVVVGMIVATDQDRTFVIPVTALSEFKPESQQINDELKYIVDVGSIQPVPDWGAPAEVKFTVTNVGSHIVKITSIALSILSREQLLEPHHFLPGAIVEEYLLQAHLIPDQNLYELLDAHHILNTGETDGFKVQITSEEGWKYSISIIVSIKILGTELTESSTIGPIELFFRIQSNEKLLELVREKRLKKDQENL